MRHIFISLFFICTFFRVFGTGLHVAKIEKIPYPSKFFMYFYSVETAELTGFVFTKHLTIIDLKDSTLEEQFFIIKLSLATETSRSVATAPDTTESMKVFNIVILRNPTNSSYIIDFYGMDEEAGFYRFRKHIRPGTAFTPFYENLYEKEPDIYKHILLNFLYEYLIKLESSNDDDNQIAVIEELLASQEVRVPVSSASDSPAHEVDFHIVERPLPMPSIPPVPRAPPTHLEAAPQDGVVVSAGDRGVFNSVASAFTWLTGK